MHTPIHSIEVLKTRQAAKDDESGTMITAYNEKHHGHESEYNIVWQLRRDIRLLGDQKTAKGFCVDCEEDTYMVSDSDTGKNVELCKGCINVIRRQSLVHRASSELCLNCEITFDSVGLISGANHVTFPIEDEPILDHGKSTKTALLDAFSNNFDSTHILTSDAINTWEAFETFLTSVKDKTIEPTNMPLVVMQRMLSSALTLDEWLKGAIGLVDNKTIRIKSTRSGLTTLLSGNKVMLDDETDRIDILD